MELCEELFVLQICFGERDVVGAVASGRSGQHPRDLVEVYLRTLVGRRLGLAGCLVAAASEPGHQRIGLDKEKEIRFNKERDYLFFSCSFSVCPCSTIKIPDE